MEILSLLIVAVLCCIILGLLWLLAQRIPRNVLQRAEQEKNVTVIELTKVQERERILQQGKELAEQALESERRERAAIERTLEGTNAYLQAQQEKYQSQQEEMQQLRKQFHLEFQQMANAILEEKTQKFTAVNQQQLDQILTPLKEKIKTFEDKVERTYQQEAAERNVLKGVVEQLMQQSIVSKSESSNLIKAVSGYTKKQGSWGKIILDRVLERSGLVKDQEYRLQAIFEEDNNRKIPDAVILIPDDNHLVIDSKVSLTAYERWANEEDETEQASYLRQHVHSVESHIRQLSAKNYHDLYGIHS